MVAINQRKQPESNQLRSDKLRSASEQSGNSEKKNHSSSHTFVVPQQATKFFVANDSTIAFVNSVFLSHTSATTFQYDKLGRQTSITRDAGGDLESISSVHYDAIVTRT